MALSIDMVLFSDFHAHNHTYNAKWVEFEGKVINSRLMNAVLTLRQIRKYCVDKRIYYVLFGGDLFHTREAVKTTVYNTIVKELMAFTEDDIRLIMIPGNHDMADREGLHHSLEHLNSNEKISVMDGAWFERVSKPHALPLWCGSLDEAVAIFPVPYTEDRDKAKDRFQRAAAGAARLPANVPTILLAHQGIQGADLGADYIQLDEHDLSLSDVPLDAFTCAWFGHFHKHQRLAEHAYYIGATEQHNWGDAGQRRGFIHLTMDIVTKAYRFRFVESESPKFVHVYANEPVITVPRRTDFARVHTANETTEELKKTYEVMFGCSVEMISSKKNTEAEFVLQEDQLHAHGLVDAWVDQRAVDGYDKDRLKTIGKKLLAKAESRGL